MVLLVINLDDAAEFIKISEEITNIGLNGIVFPSLSLKHTATSSSIDGTPIFGSLSSLMKQTSDRTNTIFILLKEEELEEVQNIVRQVSASFSGHGKMFAVPVITSEQIGN